MTSPLASFDPVALLSLSLVREFLARRRLTGTLNSLYQELGERPAATTTTAVAASLGLQEILKENKKSPAPRETLLEMLAEKLYRNSSEEEKKNSAAPQEQQGKTQKNEKIQPMQLNKEKIERPEKIEKFEKNAKMENYEKIEKKEKNERIEKNITPRLSTPVESSYSSSSSALVVEDFEELSMSPRRQQKINKNFHQQREIVNNHNTPAPSLGASIPISLENALDLRNLLFGSDNSSLNFPDSWARQGFFFKPPGELADVPELSFALVQTNGGPCGVLAAVQAFLLKELVFSSAVPNNRRRVALATTGASRDFALVMALSNILWLAGGCRVARVAVKGSSANFHNPRYRSDGLSDRLQIFEIPSLDGLKRFFQSRLADFQAPSGAGVLLFLYSALLSRTLAGVSEDRDDLSSPLIGEHFYCTQDLVNLLITGRARSNVFDGMKKIDEEMNLRGIDQRGQVGFLSLFEHFQYLQVGEFLKNPLCPVWVICSESHYTVFFTLDDSANSRNPPDRFDLFYYDQLALQREEIRLTVALDKKNPAPTDAQLEPPINNVIRTRWGAHARIDWNSSEPIL